MGAPYTARNHVTFESTAVARIALMDVVEDFRSFWMPTEARKFRGPHPSRLGRAVWFEFSWNAEHYHQVHLSHVDVKELRALASHSVQQVGSGVVSTILSQWLIQSYRFTDQRWYSDEEWRQRASGSDSPW